MPERSKCVCMDTVHLVWLPMRAITVLRFPVYQAVNYIVLQDVNTFGQDIVLCKLQTDLTDPTGSYITMFCIVCVFTRRRLPTSNIKDKTKPFSQLNH